MSAVTATPSAGRAKVPEVQPVATVRTVLRRDIADVLRDALPALAMVPREKVYDRVMDDPHLLHQAFQLFRARPELFKHMVITPERAFPTSDGDVLWCGRTLAEIIALVVRACARRYFKKRLSGPKPRPLPMPKVGLFQGICISLGLADPPKRPKLKRRPNPAEQLYNSIRDLLHFEWQVPLIPAYAALSPHLVTKLGEGLLEFRDPLKLQVLADQSAETALVDGKVPLLLDSAQRLITPNTDTINAEVLWNVSQKMRMAALFPGYDTSDMRRAVSLVAATSPAALKHLLPVLGDDIRKFTLYLFTAYGKFGPGRYRQVLGADGQAWMVEAMAQRAAKEPPLTGTHEQWKAVIESWLDSAIETMDTDEAKQAEVMGALGKVK
ncbi:MAG TPA: hypothetical protein VL974_15970 [Magnetospirillum sp.]|jgi:hypothetical protein|nr:hypothetical protein [Magnetospirillum sp.]